MVLKYKFAHQIHINIIRTRKNIHLTISLNTPDNLSSVS